LQASAGLASSQCFCFLATKDHFSSNWTSWVAGGKSHEFVVVLAGLVAGESSQAHDGVVFDTDEAAGLPHATALGEVVEHIEGFGLGESGVEQGSALALGEAGLAAAAGEQPAPVLAVAEGDAEVTLAAQAVIGAVGILAAEVAEVVHGHSRENWDTHLDSSTLPL
jgi:hypothetical protein